MVWPGVTRRMPTHSALIKQRLDEPRKSQADEQVEHIRADYVGDTHVHHALLDDHYARVGVRYACSSRYESNRHQAVWYAQRKADYSDLPKIL
jgi:hypothetical protein